jgi:hypothetical protein
MLRFHKKSILLFTILALATSLYAMELPQSNNDDGRGLVFDQEIERVMGDMNITSFGGGLADKSFVAALLKNPVVIDHLCRPFSEVQLDAKGDLILYSKCERELYEKKYLFIPFRMSDGLRKFEGFSLHGTVPEVASKLTERILPLASSGIKIGELNDVYQVRFSINELVHTKQPWNFILFPHSKDAHACFMLAMAKPESHEPLVTFMVNSWDSKEYHDFIEYRFNMKNYYQNYVHPLFCAEQIHYSCKDGYDNITIPFVDASFDIQIEDNDKNCSLYSIEFIKAAVAFLQSKQSNLFVALCNAEKFDTAAKVLNRGMKSYLWYYQESDDGLYALKNQKKIRQYHIEQRWNIGCDAIKEFAAQQ